MTMNDNAGPAPHRASLLNRIVTSRLASGLGASGASLGITLLVQILTIPIFLGTVGQQALAEWLVLTAVPAYLALGDLGFAGAAATRVAQELASDDYARARATLSSAWVTVTAASALLFSLVLVLADEVLTPAAFPALGSGARMVLVLQLLWVCAILQMGYQEAALRASGRYALGANFLTAVRLVEFIALALVLLVTRDVVLVAWVLLGVRVISALVLHMVTRRALSWFGLHLRNARLEVVRHLLSPSLTFLALASGYAFVNQGIVLLVGAQLGAAAVVALTTVRTMTNAVQQTSLVVTTGSLPEITIALAQANLHRGTRLARFSIILATASCTLVAVLIMILGPQIVLIWTSGEVRVEHLFIVLMAVSTLADVPWQVASNVLRAENRHASVGYAFLVAGVTVLVACAVSLPVYGLVAVPVALLLIDLIVTPVALVALRRQLGKGRKGATLNVSG